MHSAQAYMVAPWCSNTLWDFVCEGVCVCVSEGVSVCVSEGVCVLMCHL